MGAENALRVAMKSLRVALDVPLATLFDYLPQGTTLALHDDVAAAIEEFWRDAQSRFSLLGGDPERPLLPPAQMFVPAEEFYLRTLAEPALDVNGFESGSPHPQETVPPVEAGANP